MGQCDYAPLKCDTCGGVLPLAALEKGKTVICSGCNTKIRLWSEPKKPVFKVPKGVQVGQ